MVTDKDREASSEIIAIVASQFLSGNSYGMQDRITEKLAAYRAESAEQAMKEAAERVRKEFGVTQGGSDTITRVCFAIISPLLNVGNDEQVPTERNTIDADKPSKLAIDVLNIVRDSRVNISFPGEGFWLTETQAAYLIEKYAEAYALKKCAGCTKEHAE